VNIEINLFPELMKMIQVWIATGILFFFFYKFFWKHVVAYFKKRQDYMTEQISSSASANKNAIEYEAQANETMRQARIDAKNIVDRSKNEAIKVREDIVAKAKQEANDKIDNARLEIEREKVHAKKELQSEIVDVAMLAAKEIVKDNIDEKKSEAIVDDFIKELKA
jgi:F-type H+-transporting ATPase subunit b